MNPPSPQKKKKLSEVCNDGLIGNGSISSLQPNCQPPLFAAPFLQVFDDVMSLVLSPLPCRKCLELLNTSNPPRWKLLVTVALPTGLLDHFPSACLDSRPTGAVESVCQILSLARMDFVFHFSVLFMIQKQSVHNFDAILAAHWLHHVVNNRRQMLV